MKPSPYSFLTSRDALIFRVTHIRNIPWILDHGLHCRNSAILDPNFVEIGIRDLIAQRARQAMPISPGGVLSDYIPFYFTPRSVMLLKIVSGHGVGKVPHEELAILVGSLRVLAAKGVRLVLTDRHASLITAQRTNDVEEGLQRIDWPILQASDFRRGDDDPGRHERYQAEALAYQHIPVTSLDRIVCYGPEQKGPLAREIANRGLLLGLEVHPDWFFG